MQKREVRLLRYVRDEPQTRVPTPLSESLRRLGLASPDGDLLQVYTQNGTRIYPVGGTSHVAWPDSTCQTSCFRVMRIDGHTLRVLQHAVTIDGQEVRLTMGGNR